MTQNFKCRLCDDIYEMVNHMISERNKLSQKEYKRQGREGDPLVILQKIKM